MSEFDIQFKPCTLIKGQVVAGFIIDSTDVEIPYSKIVGEQSKQ